MTVVVKSKLRNKVPLLFQVLLSTLKNMRLKWKQSYLTFGMLGKKRFLERKAIITNRPIIDSIRTMKSLLLI